MYLSNMHTYVSTCLYLYVQILFKEIRNWQESSNPAIFPSVYIDRSYTSVLGAAAPKTQKGILYTLPSLVSNTIAIESFSWKGFRKEARQRTSCIRVHVYIERPFHETHGILVVVALPENVPIFSRGKIIYGCINAL